MGADIVGWRNCPLQAELGEDGFLWKLKLWVIKKRVEEQVPIANRSTISINLAGTNREARKLSYPDIVQELGGFEQGIPECGSCPISCGTTLGCYKYIPYPVDAVFERLVFHFFVSQLPIKDSICSQLYSDIVSRCPSSGTPWHTQRREQGILASLAKPLQYEWGGLFSKKRVDSAQVLSSLFVSLNNPAVVVGYANFWMQFFEYVDGRRAEESNTLVAMRNALPLYALITPIALQAGGKIIVDG